MVFSSYLFNSVCSHVYYMSGDAWKEGGIDATGKHSFMPLHALIILVLTVEENNNLVLCEKLPGLSDFNVPLL